MKIEILLNSESRHFMIKCSVHENNERNIPCEECYNDFLHKKFLDRTFIIIKRFRECECYKENTPTLFVEVYASNKRYIRYIDIVEAFNLIEERCYLKRYPCCHNNLVSLEENSEVQYTGYFI